MEETVVVRCPRCGREGSIQVKRVKGGSGKWYDAYYVAHYLTKKDGKKGVKWCHVSKSFVEAIQRMTLKLLEEGKIHF